MIIIEENGPHLHEAEHTVHLLPRIVLENTPLLTNVTCTTEFSILLYDDTPAQAASTAVAVYIRKSVTETDLLAEGSQIPNEARTMTMTEHLIEATATEEEKASIVAWTTILAEAFNVFRPSLQLVLVDSGRFIRKLIPDMVETPFPPAINITMAAHRRNTVSLVDHRTAMT